MSAAPGAVAGPRMPHLTALTIVRFFAALVVLMYHFVDFVTFPGALAVVAHQGQAGVGFFFLLSGFILTYNYHAWFALGVRAADFRSFFRARFARVFPMHALALAAITPVVLYLWSREPLLQSGRVYAVLDWPVVGVSWLANFVLVQAWLPLPVIGKLWNTPAWSISAEFFFYALFPFVLAAGLMRRSPGQLAWAALGLLLLEAAACLALALLVPHMWPDRTGGLQVQMVQMASEFFPPVRLGEFVIGCLLAACFVNERSRPLPVLAWFRRTVPRNVLLLLALALAYALCWLPFLGGFKGYLVWLLTRYVAFVPFFAVIIYALASGPTVLSRLLEQRWMVRLGEASYALYITHWIAVIALRYQVGPWPTTPGLALGVMAGLIGLSVLLQVWVEQPMRRRLNGRPAG